MQKNSKETNNYIFFDWNWIEIDKNYPYDLVWDEKDDSYLYQAIMDIMRAHSWEVTWRNRHKSWKDKLYIRFFELRGNIQPCKEKRGFILPTGKKEKAIERKFQYVYEELRNKWVHEEMDSIIVPAKEWQEMKHKIDMLWYAPGMPGCMEEINAASQSFCTTDDK